MKKWKGDILWAALLLIWILMLAIPVVRIVFIQFTEGHPYMGGFIKFFILASMGDMLGGRILKGEWSIPDTFFLKAIVWGIIGMMVTLVFTVYLEGVTGAQAAGRLPFEGSPIARALFGSMIMNLTFGPMMYIYHRFGDLLVEMAYEKKAKRLTSITLEDMVRRIDWYRMVSFSWLKNCVLVWIPCHTIVFLMPPEYRVLASAFLSILLGILIAVSKKKLNSEAGT